MVRYPIIIYFSFSETMLILIVIIVVLLTTPLVTRPPKDNKIKTPYQFCGK